VSRLFDGRYPNYNSVIPQNNPHKLTVDRAAMISTLRRVAIFSSQVSLIKLHLEENKVVISAQDTDFSTSAEESIVCSYNGASMNIGFRASFLIDILNNTPGQDVVIELADPSRAGVIVPAEQVGKQELLMLLMPMMLTE
jgi:DNA polymerase-3 subunit beta